MSKIKDIFDGEIVSCWEDGEVVYLAFPWVTVNFPKDEWKNVKKDLRELSKK